MLSKITVYIVLFLFVKEIIKAGWPEFIGDESELGHFMKQVKADIKQSIELSSFCSNITDTDNKGYYNAESDNTYNKSETFVDRLTDMFENAEQVALVELACEQDRMRKEKEKEYWSDNIWFDDDKKDDNCWGYGYDSWDDDDDYYDY